MREWRCLKVSGKGVSSDLFCFVMFLSNFFSIMVLIKERVVQAQNESQLQCKIKYSPAGTIVSSVEVHRECFSDSNFLQHLWGALKLRLDQGSHHIRMFALSHTASLKWVPPSLVLLLQPHRHRRDASESSHDHHAKKKCFAHRAARQALVSQQTMRDCSANRHAE